MGRYTAQQYEVLFNQEAERGYDRKEWSTKLEHQSVLYYRTIRVEAGPFVEIYSFPVWEWQREATRAKKANPTEQAQQIQNQKDASRKLTWYTNANFTPRDLFITLDYKGAPPATAEEARKDIQAFLRRVKRAREKLGLPELKYIYVIEYCDGDGRKVRVHHHLIMSGMDRDLVEELWGKGRANAHKLQPDEYGFSGLAIYINKTRRHRKPNEKIFCYSRNLKKPKFTVSEKKVSMRDVERIAADEAGIRERMEHKEPGCILNDLSFKISAYVPGAYVIARYRKIIPKWSPQQAPPKPKPKKKRRNKGHGKTKGTD
jgi:hypothetical protein